VLVTGETLADRGQGGHVVRAVEHRDCAGGLGDPLEKQLGIQPLPVADDRVTVLTVRRTVSGKQLPGKFRPEATLVEEAAC